MHENYILIEKFYVAFANADHKKMNECYHDDIEFEDPAFGSLKGDRAKAMWEMLLSRGPEKPKITFEVVKANDKKGKANWVAKYKYGKKKRLVINEITANFVFHENKIIKHTDFFNLWKWCRQALGISGLFLGWSNFMKKKIRAKTNKALNDFILKFHPEIFQE